MLVFFARLITVLDYLAIFDCGRARACAHTHTHTHTHIYIYIHTHTHTHEHSENVVVRTLHCKYSGCEFESVSHLCLLNVSLRSSPRPYVLGMTCAEAKQTIQPLNVDLLCQYINQLVSRSVSQSVSQSVGQSVFISG